MLRIILALVATTALVLLSFGPSSTSARLPDEEARQPAGSVSRFNGLGAPAEADLNVSVPDRKSDVKLASGALREAVSSLRNGHQAGGNVQLVGQRARVEILHSMSEDGIEALVESLGGTIDGGVPGVLVEGLVPWQQLEALEASPGVDFIRPPLNASIPIYDPPPPSSGFAQGLSGAVVGQEVSKMNADDWHAAGYTGDGVKIGIVDYFDGTIWNNAQSAGEVPPPSGTFCRVSGSTCNIWSITAGEQHGTAVAEVIHEMAPDAELYLAFVGTTSDLQAAVNYFDSQGVQVVSRSLGSAYDGPGDGTGAIDAVVDYAVSNGMIWLNAAGNSAGPGLIGRGSYWRGMWIDIDNDGWLNFGPNDEHLGFACYGVWGLRWNDFYTAQPTDYDVFVYADPNDLFPISSSTDSQVSGAAPIENNFTCSPGAIYYLKIGLWHPGSGTSGDILEFGVNGQGLEYWQNPYSASGPASDSANAGALSIGAIDPPLGTTIASYSSQGPTNDGRTKPDLSAAACVSSYTLSPCFNGTSSATPAVAGAAALVLDAGLATSPSQLKAWLLNNATVDRGAGGTDNVYGNGELILPAPPAAPTPTPSPTPTPTAPPTTTPTPSKTPTPTPTHTPGGQTPTSTPTSTPTHTPTPTPTPVPPTRAGDVDCSGGVNSVDSLKILRYVAGMGVQQNGSCTVIGGGVPGLAPQSHGGQHYQGDVDCNGSVNSVDSLKVLRYVADMSNNLPGGCPAIGSVPATPTPTSTQAPTPTATPTPTPVSTPGKTPTPAPTPQATATPDPVPDENCPNIAPPISIPDDYAPGIAVPFVLDGYDTIADLDICLHISHAWIGDLFVSLRHDDTATTVVLLDRPGVPATEFGCGGQTIKVYLDDEASDPVEDACPPLGSLQPEEPLSAFDGEEIGGSWTLIVADRAAGQGGTLKGLELWYLPE